jgi:hypothetical protein
VERGRGGRGRLGEKGGGAEKRGKKGEGGSRQRRGDRRGLYT